MLSGREGHGDDVYQGEVGDATRARLYARLPVLDSDRWWIEQAAAAPGERVLELGAGTGRLAAAMAAAGAEVTAVERDPTMAAHLRRRAASADGHVEVVEADAVSLPHGLGGGFGLVVLASSLLNEVLDEGDRLALLRAARRACRPDGYVAIQVLGPWWLDDMPAHAIGGLAPMGGGPAVTVDIERQASSTSTRRRQARLTYRFPDGEALADHLDADVLTSGEVACSLDEAGLAISGWWGAQPPAPPDASDPVRFLLARPR